MFCNQCGEENRNDRKFCTNCGAPLRDYTKPRENLIMPEEIEKQKMAVEKKNKISKIFGIVSIVLQFIVIVLLAISFFVNEPKDLIMLIVAMSIEIIFFICMIVKNNLIKKSTKELNNEKN